MPIVLQNYPIAYYPTSKVACTSIKLALYELDNGKKFENWEDDKGIKRHIHNSWAETRHFATLSKSELYYKFCVVRDPIARFLSAYGNRVVYYGELSEVNLQKSAEKICGLKPNPSLGEFISGLRLYRAASPDIRHHTDPQVCFVGKSTDYYNRVFSFNDLPQIAGDLNRALGIEVRLPHVQNGGPRLSETQLSKEERRCIYEFYEDDYVFLREYYQPS